MRDTSSHPNDWAKLISELTQRPGWSQARLAREVGVDRKTIARWVSGSITNIETDSVKAVAAFMAREGMDPNAAAIAAGSLQRAIQAEAEAEDEKAIRVIRESDAPEAVKAELIEHLREMRQTHQDERLRAVEILLRAVHAKG